MYFLRARAKKPDDWILELPNLGSRRFRALDALGVERIVEIPDSFAIGPLHTRIRDVLRGDAPPRERGLGPALESSGPPAFYLDFETVGPAIPLYPGAHPYEAIPFQWSLHHADANGRLSHAAFLAEGREDPRRELAVLLLAALHSSEAPIVAYSEYERTVLTGLGRHLPDLARELAHVRSRLVDLHRVVRSHFYHSEFHGSFSLKRVAAVLTPGFGYGDLEGVADGASAAASFERWREVWSVRRVIRARNCACSALLALVVGGIAAGPAAAATIVADHFGMNDPLTEGFLRGGPLPPLGGGVTVGPVDDGGTPAWAFDDTSSSPGSVRWYERTISDAAIAAGNANGWTLTSTLRVFETDGAFGTIFAGYLDGSTSWQMNFSRADTGETLVQLFTSFFGTSTDVLVPADDLYHTYDLIFDPIGGTADFFVDGVERLSDHTGFSDYTGFIANDEAARFGAGAPSGTGKGNFNAMRLTIVPEPASALLLGFGVAGLALGRRGARSAGSGAAFVV